MELRALMTILVDVEPAVLLGHHPGGERRLIAFRGGTFSGPSIGTGTVEVGGVDWQVVRDDGVIEIRAQYVLRTDADELIEVRSDGIRVAAPDVVDRIAAGEHVDPSEYYFRTHVRLATSAARLDHLNRVIAVASGERRAAGVTIHVFEVT